MLEITPKTGDAAQRFQAVVVAPKGRAGRPAPVVLFPHGGPHSAIAANYYAPFALLTALGYAVVAVNFRGSTGFGEAALQSLPGRAGRQDVDDCLEALDAAIAAGVADGGRAAVIGGSHGGFLAGAFFLGGCPLLSSLSSCSCLPLPGHVAPFAPFRSRRQQPNNHSDDNHQPQQATSSGSSPTASAAPGCATPCSTSR